MFELNTLSAMALTKVERERLADYALATSSGTLLDPSFLELLHFTR